MTINHFGFHKRSTCWK